MSGRVKVVRILSNPHKPKRKKTAKGRRRKSKKAVRRRPRAKREKTTKFLVQACNAGGKLVYGSSSGRFTTRAAAQRYPSFKTAEAAMKKLEPWAVRARYEWIQVVAT